MCVSVAFWVSYWSFLIAAKFTTFTGMSCDTSVRRRRRKRRDEQTQASVQSFSCSRPNNTHSLWEPVVQAGRGHAASCLSVCEQLGSQLQCCVCLRVSMCATSEVACMSTLKKSMPSDKVDQALVDWRAEEVEGGKNALKHNSWRNVIIGALMCVNFGIEQGKGPLIGYRNLTREDVLCILVTWTCTHTNGAAYTREINDESSVPKRGVCFLRGNMGTLSMSVCRGHG